MILKLQKSKIIKQVAPSGIFANTKSVAGATQILKDVNAASGTIGKRPRVLILKNTPGKYVMVKPIAKTINTAQQAIEDRAYEIKSNQIDLARKLREREEREGIVTQPWMRKAMMDAIAINPKTSTPPPKMNYKLPYRSWYSDGQPIMFEGETAKDWMDVTGDYYKIGPHSEILQINKPFRAAVAYHDNIGEVPNPKPLSKREPMNKASDINMMMLRDGLGRLRDWWFKEQIPTIPKAKSVKNIVPDILDIMKTSRPIITITTDAERIPWKYIEGEYRPYSTFEQPDYNFEELFRKTYDYEGSLLEPLKEKHGGKI